MLANLRRFSSAGLGVWNWGIGVSGQGSVLVGDRAEVFKDSGLDVGALIIRIGFWGLPWYSYSRVYPQTLG